MNKINSDSEMATTCETIHVTHFVNPHCFYFKFDSDLHDDQLQILEDEISKTAHSLIKNGETIARNKGDVVAAYVTQWSKWVNFYFYLQSVQWFLRSFHMFAVTSM